MFQHFDIVGKNQLSFRAGIICDLRASEQNILANNPQQIFQPMPVRLFFGDKEMRHSFYSFNRCDKKALPLPHSLAPNRRPRRWTIQQKSFALPGVEG
jgi:hypothetical protein